MSEMEVIKLSNGKELRLCFADFSVALDLKDAILKELAAQNIDIKAVLCRYRYYRAVFVFCLFEKFLYLAMIL